MDHRQVLAETGDDSETDCEEQLSSGPITDDEYDLSDEAYGDFLTNKVSEKEAECSKKKEQLNELHQELLFISIRKGDFELLQEQLSYFARNFIDISALRDKKNQSVLYAVLQAINTGDTLSFLKIFF